jgi:hypothetical protein
VEYTTGTAKRLTPKHVSKLLYFKRTKTILTTAVKTLLQFFDHQHDMSDILQIPVVFGGLLATLTCNKQHNR